jgi:hypothetical protein
VGLAPIGKRRLFTAHTQSGHRLRFRRTLALANVNHAIPDIMYLNKTEN